MLLTLTLILCGPLGACEKTKAFQEILVRYKKNIFTVVLDLPHARVSHIKYMASKLLNRHINLLSLRAVGVYSLSSREDISRDLKDEEELENIMEEYFTNYFEVGLSLRAYKPSCLK